jgi:hypothetical protein
MTPPRGPSDWERIKADGWRSPLARFVDGQLLFLTVSGLAILALPFGLFTQHTVLVHTLLGLVFLPPFAAYLVRHVRTYWDYPLTQSKFTGWVAGAFAVVCVLSGVVLTWECVADVRRSETWHLVHLVTTFGLLLFLGPHLFAVWLAQRRRYGEPATAAALDGAQGHARVGLAHMVGGLAITGLLCLAIQPEPFVNEFPDDYEMSDNGPFAPSLARTVTGGAFDARSLGGSSGCGSSGCHTQIYEEWQPSAHRYAAMDVGFQAIQNVMAEQNGPVSTRYCGGCHDPISLFAGAKRIGGEELTERIGHHEGISCLACHAIQETDVKGNANYVVAQPTPYVWELKQGKLAKFLGDFLIRTYPDHHVESLSRRMFKTPEFCAACHKQFIDEEVNRVGWVQLQNQYDNWKASRWNHAGQADQTLECRECHMPLIASRDPAAGDQADFNRSADDGMHRSHRFLGANQYIPLLHDLPGAEEHVALTEQWLRGEYEVPEIADRWNEGPAVPIELATPREVVAGDTVPVRVHVTNNKAGHDFPTGPLDIIQAWVELTVTDEAGNVVFHTGTRDDENVIETGSFMFKAEPVDRYGNLIDRHNLWEMVGVRFKRSLFPGAEEVARFEFTCAGSTEPQTGEFAQQVEDHALAVPTDAVGTLTVRAALQYRKFDQFLLDYAFGEDAGLTAPVTTLSTAETTIRVLPRGEEL